MQVVDDEDEDTQEDLRLLFTCLATAVRGTGAFEFVQGLLRLALQLHGAAVTADPQLAALAASMQLDVQRVWGRLDGALASARCMLGFLSGSVT